MSNRAAKYELLHKSLKKHYKPISEPAERTVLEHLVYACCLEDAKYEQADEAFAKLQQAYFDWNEVRVTTVIELGEALSSLPSPTQAGHRIKRCLQSLFECRYQYDIEDMKKANLTKATDELTAWKGVTPFILAYVSQNALGGHFIPADSMTLETLVQADFLTEAEAEKKVLPGVERAIPKTKGSEFSTLLHQFAIDFQQNQKNATALAVFKDLGVVPKAKPKQVPAAAQDKKKSAKPTDIDEPVAAKTNTKPLNVADDAAAKKKVDKSNTVETPTTKGKEPSGKIAAGKVEPPKPSIKKVEATSELDTKLAAGKKTAIKKDAPASTEASKKAASKAPADAKQPEKKKGEEKSPPAAKKPAAVAPKPKLETKKPTVAKKTSKATPPKTSPPKPAASKTTSKEATNVKMTKKKPR